MRNCVAFVRICKVNAIRINEVSLMGGNYPVRIHGGVLSAIAQICKVYGSVKRTTENDLVTRADLS